MMPKKVLFFIKGIAPTADEIAAAGRVATMTFRSMQSYTPTDFIEQCDAVAGCAPKRYRDKYPYLESNEKKPEAKKPEVSTPPQAPSAPTTTPAPAAPGAPWQK